MEQQKPSKSEAPATQEQAIRELIYKLQIYQAESENLQQQAGLIELSLGEIESAIQTLGSMNEVKAGQEIMVPVGAGTHVYANMARLDKIVINIGAGVSVEQDIEEAKKILEKRQGELRQAYEQTIGQIGTIASEIQKLQQEAQKYRKE